MKPTEWAQHSRKAEDLLSVNSLTCETSNTPLKFQW